MVGERRGRCGLRHAFLCVLIAISAVKVFAAVDHCMPDEQVIFSCGMKTSSKVLSICASRVLSKDKGYIQYRFGAPGNVELEFPSSREGSQGKFAYFHYFRAQVDRTEVGFKNGKYEYSVFSDYEGDIKPETYKSGVSITDSSSGKEQTFLCRGKPVNRLALLSKIIPCEEDEASGACQ